MASASLHASLPSERPSLGVVAQPGGALQQHLGPMACGALADLLNRERRWSSPGERWSAQT